MDGVCSMNVIKSFAQRLSARMTQGLLGCVVARCQRFGGPCCLHLQGIPPHHLTVSCHRTPRRHYSVYIHVELFRVVMLLWYSFPQI